MDLKTKLYIIWLVLITPSEWYSIIKMTIEYYKDKKKRDMKKMIKFPSIEQFRTIVSNVLRHFNYVGQDENDEAIYDTTKPKPTLKFKGSVKLHGTNAAVSYNEVGGLWAQSRENIITVEKDNAGFAFFVDSNRAMFIKLIAEVLIKNNLDAKENTVTIYGEWCGGNIQKGVGITNLPKSFFIFGVKVSPIVADEEAKLKPAYWVDYDYLRSPDNKIFNILDYPTWEIDIDFNMPQLVQNKLSELTLAVEEECPVAKAFGFSGIGEGIVWSTELNGVVYRFKCKGELHAGKSKVITLKPVDDVKIMKTIEISEKVTPTWRLAQMLEQSCDLLNGGTLDRSNLGKFIKLVMADVVKEDVDILLEAGLEPKDIGKYVSEIAKRYFFDQELL